MNTQVLIVALLTVIIVMVVAGVYFMFFATSKKRREDGYAAVPDDSVVRVRAAVKGVNGRKVSFEADIDDIMPALEDLVQENDFRPLTDVERLFDPSTTEEEKLVIMKRMEDAGYEITYKGYDRERAAELERLEKGRENPSGGDGGAPEEGPDGDSGDGGPEDSPEDEADDRYVPPVPEDYGEGEVDPLSGMSMESEKTQELPKGEHFVFVRKPVQDVALLTEMLDFVAGAFAEDNLSPELVLFLEMRFGARFEDSLWNEEKRARARERVAAYDRNPQLAILTVEGWFQYLRKIVGSFREATAKNAAEGKKTDVQPQNPAAESQEHAADAGAPQYSGKPSEQESAPAKESAEEERDYSSLFIGKDGGKLDAMWERLGPKKK